MRRLGIGIIYAVTWVIRALQYTPITVQSEHTSRGHQQTGHRMHHTVDTEQRGHWECWHHMSSRRENRSRWRRSTAKSGWNRLMGDQSWVIILEFLLNCWMKNPLWYRWEKLEITVNNCDHISMRKRTITSFRYNGQTNAYENMYMSSLTIPMEKLSNGTFLVVEE